jgi:putative ABC transport system permease protein
MRLRRFSGISLRNLRARAQRTLLTTIGIVLGVGIVFGVITLSDTMSSTFSDLYSRAFGAADITVTAAGGSGMFDDSVVKKVRGYEGVESAAPRLSLPASLILDKKQPNGLPEVRSMRLLGVEPESASLATGFELTQGRFPESGREITLDGGSAESTGLKVGDKVTLGTPRGPEKLELVGILRVPGGSFGGLGFGMAPLPYAQAAFDEPGRRGAKEAGPGARGRVAG